MATFTEQMTIRAPVERVWAALADIGSIARWNPGVKASHLTTPRGEGVGAARYCDLGGRSYLEETVAEWEPGKRLTMRITGTNMPFARGEIHFSLRPEGTSTVVTLTPDYLLRFGPLGHLLDRLLVRRTYRRGMAAALAGLKAHVERGAGGGGSSGLGAA